MAEHSYRETLEALKGRLSLLDEERHKLVHAIEAIEALLATGSVIGPRDPKTKDSSPSYAEGAEKILMDKGGPMHISNILHEAKKRGWYPDKDLGDRSFRNSMVGTLDRKVRAGDTFTKPEPATYGLVEWEKDTVTISESQKALI